IMTRTQKIIGSSVLSLLLLAITMFSMCSVRMQKLNTDGDIDDLAFEEFDEGDEEYQDDLLSRLEVLDGEEATETTNSDDIFSTLSDETYAESTPSLEPAGTGDAESFLTPELIDDLQAEVNDLEKIYQSKERTADSLRQKVREVEFADATTSGFEQTQNFIDTSLDNLDLPTTTSPASISTPNYMDSEIGALYQDALDDYNSRRFGNAVSKFRAILYRGNAGSLADNCQYWIGESYYAQGKYLQAVVEFEKVNIYPQENKATDAQLMTGLAFMKLGDNQQARNELSTLTTFNRNAGAARKARRYLNTI
ncbi:MAG: tetratricopeptide repeat protein, partial [bacterium]